MKSAKRSPPSTTFPTVVSLYRFAEDIRSQNSDLDDLLLQTLEQVPEWPLHDQDSHARRTVAEQLGHLAESSNYVACQMEWWLMGRRAVVGRCTPEDPDFQDALLRAADADMATLCSDLEQALARLQTLLASVGDIHLRATVNNVKYGREPVALLLVRDVLAHKSGHIHELTASVSMFGPEPQSTRLRASTSPLPELSQISSLQ